MSGTWIAHGERYRKISLHHVLFIHVGTAWNYGHAPYCRILVAGLISTIVQVHARMPVVLPPEAWDSWLDPDLDVPTVLQPLLKPSQKAEWRGYPVGYYSETTGPNELRRSSKLKRLRAQDHRQRIKPSGHPLPLACNIAVIILQCSFLNLCRTGGPQGWLTNHHCFGGLRVTGFYSGIRVATTPVSPITTTVFSTREQL